MSAIFEELRQSTAALLGCALCDLFPSTLLVESALSPIGFYYDVILKDNFSEEAFPLVEERMRALAKQGLPLQKMEMVRENAISFLKHHKQFILAQHLKISSQETVQLVQIGNFIDFCPNNCVSNTKQIVAFKLQRTSTRIEQLKSFGKTTITRFFGTAFPDIQSLKHFLKQSEQAYKSDHRLLGPQMRLFYLNEEQASPTWLPNGTILKNILLDLQGKHLNRTLVASSPEELPISQAQIFKAESPSLWQAPVSYHSLALLTDNCPKTELWGLLRTKNYTEAASQTFCSPLHFIKELTSSLQFIDKMIKIFGLKYNWCLNAGRPPKSNIKEEWENAVNCLTKALEASNLDYSLDKGKESPYGPMAGVQVADAFENYWTTATVTIDIVHPRQLGLKYQEEEAEKQPVMVMQSVFGSLERFIALLIEYYAGVFPLWLAPEQIRIIPVGKQQGVYANEILAILSKAGFRCSIDYHLNSLGTKVHSAEKEHIPYILIVGEKEQKNNLVTVRSPEQSAKGNSLTLASFLQKITETIGSQVES